MTLALAALAARVPESVGLAGAQVFPFLVGMVAGILAQEERCRAARAELAR